MDKIRLNVDSNNKQILSKVGGKVHYHDSHMQWTLKFSDPLDIRTINSNNVYVKDSKERKYNMFFAYDEESNDLTITPKEGYVPNEDYFLVLTTRVKAKNGRFLRNDLVIQFAQQVIERGVKVNSINVKKDINNINDIKEEKTTDTVVIDKEEEKKNHRRLLFDGDREKNFEEKYGQKRKVFTEGKEVKSAREKYGVERLKQFEEQCAIDKVKNKRSF